MASTVNWISYSRHHCEGAGPNCGEQDSSLSRRLWRRFRWRHGSIRLDGALYCSPGCFESAVQQHFERLCVTALPAPPVCHRVPLGLLMISRGQLTNPQLQSALQTQRERGQYRLGEWLERLGFATEQQVTAALARQWGCPLLSTTVSRDPHCACLLPYRILESFHILPVQFVAATRTFHLAFGDGVDYSALYAIEQMLDCRTQVCLSTRSGVQQALQLLGQERRPRELVFEGWRDASEMARIACGYVLKLGAEEVRLAACRGFTWARLSTGCDVATLLFCQPSEGPQVAARF